MFELLMVACTAGEVFLGSMGITASWETISAVASARYARNDGFEVSPVVLDTVNERQQGGKSRANSTHDTLPEIDP